MNLNDQVEVTLTDFGRDCLREWCAELGVTPAPREMRPGPVKFQLWFLMQVFGTEFYMGARDLPFENNEITILE